MVTDKKLYIYRSITGQIQGFERGVRVFERVMMSKLGLSRRNFIILCYVAGASFCCARLRPSRLPEGPPEPTVPTLQSLSGMLYAHLYSGGWSNPSVYDGRTFPTDIAKKSMNLGRIPVSDLDTLLSSSSGIKFVRSHVNKEHPSYSDSPSIIFTPSDRLIYAHNSNSSIMHSAENDEGAMRENPDIGSRTVHRLGGSSVEGFVPLSVEHSYGEFRFPLKPIDGWNISWKGCVAGAVEPGAKYSLEYAESFGKFVGQAMEYFSQILPHDLRSQYMSIAVELFIANQKSGKWPNFGDDLVGGVIRPVVYPDKKLDRFVLLEPVSYEGEDRIRIGTPEVSGKIDGGGGGGGCFLDGTLITLADNNTLAIEDKSLRKGRKVLSYEEDGNLARPRIKEKYTNTADGYYRLVIGDTVLNVTESQPILTTSGWKSPSDITDLGEKIVTVRNNIPQIEKLVSALFIPGKVGVHHLDVGNPDTYIADGVVAHNKG